MELSSRWISSKNTALQVLGALFGSVFQIVLLCLMAAILIVIFAPLWQNGEWTMPRRLLALCAVTLACLTMHGVTNTLNPIFSLRREEQKITISHAILLTSWALWLIAVVLILGIRKESAAFLPLCIIGSVLTWVFQDAIKSIASFFFLRANGLLHIGDSIEVESHGIDGKVQSVSLTSVVVLNKDTTTSSFPTYLLQTGAFRNKQRVRDGLTFGKKMMKHFVVDTNRIHPLHSKEVAEIQRNIGHDHPFVVDAIKEGELNIHAYRLFVYHYLMENRFISHEPVVLVRWLDPTPYGLPLEIIAFIMDTKVLAYESHQSEIVEYLVSALPWFGLRLFQSPSSFDNDTTELYKSVKEVTNEK